MNREWKIPRSRYSDYGWTIGITGSTKHLVRTSRARYERKLLSVGEAHRHQLWHRDHVIGDINHELVDFSGVEVFKTVNLMRKNIRRWEVIGKQSTVSNGFTSATILELWSETSKNRKKIKERLHDINLLGVVPEVKKGLDLNDVSMETILAYACKMQIAQTVSAKQIPDAGTWIKQMEDEAEEC